MPIMAAGIGSIMIQRRRAASVIRQIIIVVNTDEDKVSEPPSVGLSKHTFRSEIAEQHGRFAPQSEKLPVFKIATNKY